MRVPVGARIASSGATLQLGALSPEGIPDDALQVGDFIPWSQDSYGRFQPDMKNEARRKQALSIEKFVKAGQQNPLMFSLIYGKWNYKERAECLAELERLRVARPELFTAEFVSETFEEMNFRYEAHIREGARKVMRLGSGRVRKPDFSRLPLSCIDGKSPRWEYPATSLMRHPAGLWLSRIIPKLEEKVSEATWKEVLGNSKGNENGRKAGSIPSTESLPEKRMYPSWKPLRLDVQELPRQHRPKSMKTGDYLRWDYISHAG